MGKWNRVLAAALTAAAVLSLSGCKDTTKDATIFVKGELDCTYLGTYDKAYLDVVDDMTEADAKEKYDYNVEAEASIMMDYLDINTSSETVAERAKKLVADIYSHAKYTVADAEKLKSGDLAVEVTVSPIEILPLLTGEFVQDTWYNILDQNGIASQEQLDALSDDAYDALEVEYANTVLGELEGLMSQLSYGEDQVIMLQMKKDDDGYYSLVESGMQKLDEVMIDYNGSYAAG